MNRTIILPLLCPILIACQPITLKLKVVNDQYEPVPHTTIFLHRHEPNQPVSEYRSDAKGACVLNQIDLLDTLIIKAPGYEEEKLIFEWYLRDRLTVTVCKK